jgi:hypothetical protein
MEKSCRKKKKKKLPSFPGQTMFLTMTLHAAGITASNGNAAHLLLSGESLPKHLAACLFTLFFPPFATLLVLA